MSDVWVYVAVGALILSYIIYSFSQSRRNRLRNHSEELLAALSMRIGYQHGYWAALHRKPYDDKPPEDLLHEYIR